MGARPSITVLLLTAAGGGLTVGFGQPAGVWAGYGTASAAALLGCVTLWRQRGAIERHAREMARRRLEDLEEWAVAARRHQTEIERLRADLQHERQYSGLIQDQLTRSRDQLDRERAARIAAERELDTVVGAVGWPANRPSLRLTVEEPEPAAERKAIAKAETATAEATKSKAPRTSASPASGGVSAAQRRGWQILDGDGEDETGADDSKSIDTASIDGTDSIDAEADLLYRPFIDQLSAATVPVSDAALAMAPVISAADLDDMLDLTAYDETVEFSVREIKRMA